MPVEVPVYVLMGTCGCGKTTYAEALVKEFGCHYIEGDRLHPTANVNKMSAGIPLTDDDRWGWLAAIRDTYVQKATEIVAQGLSGTSGIIVVTCSALRLVYRDLLRDVPKGSCRVVFVYLKGTYELLDSRMKARSGHFMASNMLNSQWKTLEEPDSQREDVILQDISADTDTVVKNLIKEIKKQLNV
ncbi:unnamed protein product [Medioppia subpectinata]|uniref:Gluconokinase n=1 Tax=Medioppia subpectinata TaxID=1979941 RepID=A0A7R9KG78_9ACAR|nr:unnamed protein product [Medioppia subpectinata]CAG2102820.1 unnamed protein product [Medioppia subpectinata]